MNASTVADSILIRLFDAVVAAGLFALAAGPAMLCLFASALSIGFPPVYISRRVGKNAAEYRHLKIRSMRPGTGPGRAYLEQERITRLGALLRKSHMDEALELLHIMSGRMSLVGPRALPAEHLKRFDIAVRNSVPPGWTGLAQVKLLRKGILYGPEQIKLDTIYVGRRSLAYNIRILAATFAAILRGARKAEADTKANWYRRALAENRDIEQAEAEERQRRYAPQAEKPVV